MHENKKLLKGYRYVLVNISTVYVTNVLVPITMDNKLLEFSLLFPQVSTWWAHHCSCNGSVCCIMWFTVAMVWVPREHTLNKTITLVYSYEGKNAPVLPGGGRCQPMSLRGKIFKGKREKGGGMRKERKRKKRKDEEK
jgi:hypothetical protein